MFKKLTASLENLLDHDSSASHAIETGLSEARRGYKASDNLYEIDNLSYSYATVEVDLQNVEQIIERISCFFEVVFLLESDSANSSNNSIRPAKMQKLKTAFVFGKKLNGVENWNSVQLPNVQLYKVYKTGAFRLFEKFKIQDLDSEKKMSCYLFRLGNRHSIIVASTTADPWSKLRIEKLQNSLMKINFKL